MGWGFEERKAGEVGGEGEGDENGDAGGIGVLVVSAPQSSDTTGVLAPG